MIGSAFRPTQAFLSKMLILSELEVQQCLSMSTAIIANRKALGSLRKNQDGGAVVPTRIGLPYYDDNSIHRGGIDNKNEDDDNETMDDVSRDWTLFKPAAYYPPPPTTTTPSSSPSLTKTTKEETTTTTTTTTLMGMKLVSVRANNPTLGKPTVPATILLLDAQTGEVNAMLGGTYLTAARTAAGSAVATELCTRDNSTDPIHLVVFGAGLQAECHVDAIRCVKDVRMVSIVNRSLDRARALREKIIKQDEQESDDETAGRKLFSLKDIQIVELANEEEVHRTLQDADVVVTCTNTMEPLFNGKFLKPGCHVNGVGSYTPHMTEVDKNVVDRSQVIVDTWEALQVGDLKHLDESPEELSHNVLGLLGDVIAGNTQPRENRLQTISTKIDCTFFKSVGTAIQDVMTAHEVVKCARERGIGTEVDM